MNRLMKHAAAALVLASTAPLLAEQPAASTNKRPTTTQKSKKLALPSLKIGRAFDWLTGSSSQESEKVSADEERPDESSQSDATSPSPAEPDLKQTDSKQSAKQAPVAKPTQPATAKDTPPLAREPRQTPSFPTRPVGPSVISASPPAPPTRAPAVTAAQPPRDETAIPSPPPSPLPSMPPAESRIPRIVLQVSPSIVRAAPVGAPMGNHPPDAAPVAAPAPPTVTVRPTAPPSPPRRKTRGLVADAMRYGPVARTSRSNPAETREMSDRGQPDATEPTLQARILPSADESQSGPDYLPLPAEDLAAVRPLRPEVASTAAIFAQRSSVASPVAGNASPAAILRAVHSFGAPRRGAPVLPAASLIDAKAAPRPAALRSDVPSPITPATSPKVAVNSATRPDSGSTTKASADSQADAANEEDETQEEIAAVDRDEPAEAVAATAPVGPTPSVAPQLQQPHSIRVKVLHGSVARVNATSGHVLLAFDDRPQLPPGTRVQVYRRSFFKRQAVGEVEVVSGQGDEYLARPLGKLTAAQIAVEDELVVVPSR